ncbi:hypothetical protein RND81_11G219100 [Saponaria officinalis]|uniref:Uncharacterized protein n=1 Tax=Saponaria officinalis TaxID=3572 RepID=A0AAW1HQM7_SAPOF
MDTLDEYSDIYATYDTEKPPSPENSIIDEKNDSDEPKSELNESHVETLASVDGRTLWTTGLCNWYEDWNNCCVTCCFPCITFGKIADILSRGHPGFTTSAMKYAATLVTTLAGGPCLYSFIYRVNMRGQYGLRGTTCSDCLSHFFCHPCALCQDYRELHNRGFDMDIGWHANMERNKEMLRRNQRMTTAPSVGHMNR